MVNAPALDVTEPDASGRYRPGSDPVAAVLAHTAELVGPAIDSEVARLGSGLSAPVAHHLAGGGKRIRAALVLLAARAAGGEEGDALPGAVAIELVHNFSLLHDDLIDGDRQRRHRSTVWAEFGVGPAVVGGDALATLALQVLLAEPTPARVRAAATLANATLAMISGQADDMAFETRSSVSVTECLAMEAGKTGALIECAMSLGAILVGAPDPVIEALQDFGACLGTAFQAIDDLLGIWGDPAVTGKPVGSDLLAGKKTLPVAIALAGLDGRSRELRDLLDRRWSPAGMSDAEMERAARLVEAGGGRLGAADTATRALHEAEAALDRFPLEATAVAQLAEVARFVTERTW
ncbi:MAG TPA: polyprenyl synthetase family protein [Acidimicrobiales bacterium]|nr:polyprenyl synthetase family protein [Acidimicrobiales bacterium]